MISKQAGYLISETINKMSTNKYESMKIPILKKTEYSTWKVNILTYLEASYADYLDMIYDGP